MPSLTVRKVGGTDDNNDFLARTMSPRGLEYLVKISLVSYSHVFNILCVAHRHKFKTCVTVMYCKYVFN